MPASNAPQKWILTAATLLLAAPQAISQQITSNPIHWAYSAYFGTGWYSVSGDRDVFIARFTPRWSLAEPSLDETGERHIGLFLKTPVSVGLDRFELVDPVEVIDIDNVSFLSFNPGIDVEIPVNGAWSLRPYASLGYGQVLGSGDHAWTYWAGIKSRVAIASGRSNWYLLNQAGFVGYTPGEGPSDDFWPLMAGLEFDTPIRAGADRDWLLYGHASYTMFGNDLVFSGNPVADRPIKDQWEFGLAVGRRQAPIRVWFLNFDRLGLGYRSSSDGDLKGITFVFRSLFEN